MFKLTHSSKEGLSLSLSRSDSPALSLLRAANQKQLSTSKLTNEDVTLHHKTDNTSSTDNLYEKRLLIDIRY